MSKGKIALGMLTMLAVQLVAEVLLPDFGASVAWSVAQSILVFFVGALAGGWLARDRFVFPALVVWLFIWGFVTYLLYRIAAPAEQTSIIAILQYNRLALLLSGCAAVVGALCGQMLAKHSPASA